MTDRSLVRLRVRLRNKLAHLYINNCIEFVVFACGRRDDAHRLFYVQNRKIDFQYLPLFRPLEAFSIFHDKLYVELLKIPRKRREVANTAPDESNSFRPLT